MNNWQRVTMKEAKYLTEEAGFCHQQVDWFDEDGADEFIKKGTGLKFKYRMSMGDPVSFYISPTINGKPVSAIDFITTVKEQA